MDLHVLGNVRFAGRLIIALDTGVWFVDNSRGMRVAPFVRNGWLWLYQWLMVLRQWLLLLLLLLHLNHRLRLQYLLMGLDVRLQLTFGHIDVDADGIFNFDRRLKCIIGQIRLQRTRIVRHDMRFVCGVYDVARIVVHIHFDVSIAGSCSRKAEARTRRR